MKRTKKRLLVWGLGIILVGAGGLAAAGWGVLKYRAAGWRRDGIAAAVAGDNERAAALLGRYLRHQPDDAEALTYYVKSQELAELPNGQHFAQAIAGLKLLISRDPDNLETRRHLLELYTRLERWPEALDVANAIQAHTKPVDWSDDIRTVELKVTVLRELNQKNAALAMAEQWSKLSPMNVAAHKARLELRIALHNPQPSIIADAEALRLAHPGDARFEVLQGYACALCPDIPDGYKQAVDWTTTAAAHPDLSDEVAQLVVAQFDTLGMPEKSLAMLQDMAKRGASPEVHNALARRLWELGRWESAAAALQDVSPADPSADATLLAMKVITLANLGKSSEANAARVALASRNQALTKAWDLLLRRIVDAAQVDDKQLVTLCQSALLVDPKNPYLYYYLGEANARLGESDRAIAAWEEAVHYDGTWSMPGVRLVEALLATNNADEAQRVAQYAMAHNHSAGAAVALAQAYASQGAANAKNAADLDRLVDAIQQALPGEERTTLIRVEWLNQQGRKEDAIATARAAIHQKPACSEAFLIALADKSRQYGFGLQQDCFALSQSAHGNTPRLAYARAIELFLSGGKDDALKEFDDAARQSGKPDDLDWRAARAQFLDFMFHPAARQAWIALGDAYPKELRVQQAVVAARCLQGDWDVLQKAIDRLKALTPEHAVGWRLALAKLMVESPRSEADIEQGSIKLTEILKDDAVNVQAHVLLARALVQLKRVDGAIEHLSRAAELDKSSMPIALQLAALLQSRGDFDRAQQELDRITPSLRTSAQRQRAAALLAQQGNSGQAIQLLEHATTPPGDSPADGQPDLLLAQLYRRRHEYDKAEGVVKKLMQKPDLATVRFAASLYASEGRDADAQAAIAQLDALQLDPGIAELARGSFCAETGELPKAIDHYQAAVAQAPTNPVGWRMLATLQMAVGRVEDSLSTIDRAAQSLPNDKAIAAIRVQSDLLRQAGAADEDRPVALFVMRDPLNSDNAVELLHTLVEARASNDMERLASRLQQLTERHPDFLPGQLQLIQCFALIGRTSDALGVARRAMTLFPSAPEPAGVAVQLCAAGRNWHDMEAAAEAWRGRLLDDPMPADIAIARAKIAEQQYDAAIAQLDPYAAAAAKDPDRYADVITVRCIALVHCDQAKQAKDALWPLTSKSAAWRLRWLQVAMEIPSPQEANRWIDRIQAQIPADATEERIVVAEATDILGTRAKDESLIQVATQMMSQLSAEPKATPLVLMSAGSQAERHGNVNAAEALYRRAIAVDPNLWVAQNNLAMLIVKRGGNPKEAAACAAVAARLQPKKATILDTLAQVESLAGDVKAAAQAEHTATQLDPDNPKWRVRFAEFLVKSGQLTEARQALQAIDANRAALQRLPSDEQLPLQRQLDAIRAKVQDVKAL